MNIAIGLVIFIVAYYAIVCGVTGFNFSLIPFFLGSSLLSSPTSELVVLDPITFIPITSITLKENNIYSDLAITSVNKDEDKLVFVGNEHVYQYRWRHKTAELYEIEDFTQRYRYDNDGSVMGSTPIRHRDAIYFTTNAYPNSGYIYGRMYGSSYKLYTIPIGTNNSNKTNQTSSSSNIILDGIDIDTCLDCKFKQPSFRVWSPTIFQDKTIVISDIIDGSIKYYDVSTLVLQKQVKLNSIDNIVIGGINNNMIYTTDYDKRTIPSSVKDWKRVMGTDPPKTYKKVSKDFIIIKDGNVILRKKIGFSRGIRASNIIIGGNNDVIVTTSKGLTRFSSK